MGQKRAKAERKQANRAGGESPQQENVEPQDWGDEVAQKRTADDPAVMAPHDRAGRPSTGRPL